MIMNQSLLDHLKVISPEEKELLKGEKRINHSIYMESTSMVIDSKKLLEEGKLITVRPHTRFVHFPLHTHNYVEVVYMCCGQTRHRIDGNEVELKGGELLFLNQHARQEIEPAGENDIAINFIILPAFFDKALQMLSGEENLLRDFLVGCLREKDDSTKYLHFQVAEILPIQNLVENLIWTLVNQQPNKRNINQYTMGLLFLQLLNHTDKMLVDQDHQHQTLIVQVLSYIEEHYRDGELVALAGKLHYDVYWLSREIKHQTGKNYTELVQIKRLSHALLLLESTRLSVAEVGDAVGYQNLSYFHRIFRQRYGMSPKQYRDLKQIRTLF